MLNALWAFMMLTGLGWAAVHGTLGAVTEDLFRIRLVYATIDFTVETAAQRQHKYRKDHYLKVIYSFHANHSI